MTESKLPNCPFCGSSGYEICDQIGTDPCMFKVSCMGGVEVCPVGPETRYFFSRNEARMAWRNLIGATILGLDAEKQISLPERELKED